MAAVGLRLEEGDEVSAKLPAVPTPEEEEEQARQAIQKAEEELTLEFLSSVIEEKLLVQKFDVRVPYKVRSHTPPCHWPIPAQPPPVE